MLGYRVDEVQLPVPEIPQDVLVYSCDESDNHRPVVAVSLGCHLQDASLPHADPSDVPSLLRGVEQRMGKVLPHFPGRRRFLRGLKKYVLRWLKRRGIRPLQTDHDVSFETWIESTNYPASRKDELRRVYEEMNLELNRDKHGHYENFDVKLFMKDEHYVDFKTPRGIYAREDFAKVFFGPWFKAIEQEIYKQPEFIKKIPVRERPDYIKERLWKVGGKYVATDYSSYEAHFIDTVMEHCEFVMYEYMLSNVTGGLFIVSVMREVLQGVNVVKNKFLKALIRSRRMSGEMNTSLGNGFSNLMFMGYICELEGIIAFDEELIGVVEGDDGLFVFVGKTPTTEHFAEKGFIIKLEVHSDLCTAGFCGNIFDIEDGYILTDPKKVVAGLGWSASRYTRSKTNKLKCLLRSKALSFAYQYPGCPIVGALAQYALRMTRSFDIQKFTKNRRDLNVYDRERIEEAISFRGPLYVEPKIRTRLLFEELYGISVSEQLGMEKYLNELKSLEPLKMPLLVETCPASWINYDKMYHLRIRLDEPEKFYVPVPSVA